MHVSMVGICPNSKSMASNHRFCTWVQSWPHPHRDYLTQMGLKLPAKTLLVQSSWLSDAWQILNTQAQTRRKTNCVWELTSWFLRSAENWIMANDNLKTDNNTLVSIEPESRYGIFSDIVTCLHMAHPAEVKSVFHGKLEYQDLTSLKDQIMERG